MPTIGAVADPPTDPSFSASPKDTTCPLSLATHNDGSLRAFDPAVLVVVGGTLVVVVGGGGGGDCGTRGLKALAIAASPWSFGCGSPPQLRVRVHRVATFWGIWKPL